MPIRKGRAASTAFTSPVALPVGSRHMRTRLISKLSISWQFVKERRLDPDGSRGITWLIPAMFVELQALEDQKAEADRCPDRI